MKHNLLKSLIISVILLTGVSNAWALDIYLDLGNINWPESGAIIKLYPGTGSDVQGSLLPSGVYKFTVQQASETMYFKRINPNNLNETWDQASITYDSSKNNVYKLTGWKSVENADYNISTVTPSNYIYFDNSITLLKSTNKYFVIGHDKPSAYSIAYTMDKIENTQLWYTHNLGNTWTDATYYSFFADNDAWSGNNWGISNIPTADAYTAPFTSHKNLNANKYYLCIPTNQSNNQPFSISEYSSYTDLNYTQTIKAQVKYGETNPAYQQVISPATITATTHYFGSDYTKVDQTGSLTINRGVTDPAKLTQAVTAAYTSTVTLSYTNLHDAYEFMDWWDDTNQKTISTSATCTYVATKAATIYARFKTKENYTHKIYLDARNWNEYQPRYAVYAYYGAQDGQFEWIDMTAACGTNWYYTCEVPAKYSHVIFCRMNPENNNNTFNDDSRWGQTKDLLLLLDLDVNNCFTPDKDPDMSINGKTYNGSWRTPPTFTVTLEATSNGSFQVTCNGGERTGETINNVPVGTQLTITDIIPNDGYDQTMVYSAAGANYTYFSDSTEIDGKRTYTYTVTSDVSIAEDFRTKEAHTIFVKVPKGNASAYWEDLRIIPMNGITQSKAGTTESVNKFAESMEEWQNIDEYILYYFTIPAGNHSFKLYPANNTTASNSFWYEILPKDGKKDINQNCWVINNTIDNETADGTWVASKVYLDPCKYGTYGIRCNGQEYYNYADNQRIVELPFGAVLEPIDAVSTSPHYGPNPRYASSIVINEYFEVDLNKSLTLIDQIRYSANLVTTQPHRVILHIPNNILSDWNANVPYNCVYAKDYRSYGSCQFDEASQTYIGKLIEGTKLGSEEYYYFDIPAGFNNFVFERKISLGEHVGPTEATYDFLYQIPLDENFVYTLTGIDSNGKFIGTWGKTPQCTVTLGWPNIGRYGVKDYLGSIHYVSAGGNTTFTVPYGSQVEVLKGEPRNDAYNGVIGMCDETNTVIVERFYDGKNNDNFVTITRNTMFDDLFGTEEEHVVYLGVPNKGIDACWHIDNTDDIYVCMRAQYDGGGKGLAVKEAKFVIDDVTYYKYTLRDSLYNFQFQRKTGEEDRNTPICKSRQFIYQIPTTEYNCFMLDGSKSDDEYNGYWTKLPKPNVGDYRVLYAEKELIKTHEEGETEDWETAFRTVYEHPSDIIPKGEASKTISLHINTSQKRGDKTVHPMVILQQFQQMPESNTYKWVNLQAHTVLPLKATGNMGMLPGRKKAFGDLPFYDNGIEAIKNDTTYSSRLDGLYKGSGVWNFTVTQGVSQSGTGTTVILNVGNTTRYTGKYYIRTEALTNGWNNYKDNLMTYSDYADYNSGFSHYFCKWLLTGHNVKFTIANDYAQSISDPLYADATDLWGKPIIDEQMVMVDNFQVLDEDANVRFAWYEMNNFVHRAYLGGSTHVHDRFLVVKGDDNKIFSHYVGDGLPPQGADLPVGEDGTPRYGLNADEEIFRDDANWIYHADVRILLGCNATITAKHDGVEQYFIKDAPLVLGYDPEKAEEQYPIRLLYDFKINRLITGYIPNGNNSTNIEPFTTNLMLIRKHHEQATQLLFNSNAKTTQGAYGVMTFERDFLRAPDKSNKERAAYFISFPFDVKISDVFGFGQFYKHWFIQYYDGEARAKNGLWADTDTYWKHITDPNTELKAYQGYALLLSLSNIEKSGVLDASKEISLYFPSTKNNIGNITDANPEVTVDVPAHICTIEREYRKFKDSNWNLIGVPAYADVSGFVHKTFKDPYNNDVLFYWKRDPLTDQYTVEDANTSLTFQTMHAYMLQYAGVIKWKAHEMSQPSQLIARRNTEQEASHTLRITLNQADKKLDQTYVRLQEEDATADFDMNKDQYKIKKAEANIYSLIQNAVGQIEAGANVLPLQTTVVPLGVIIKTAGEYTFSMPDGTDGIIAELIDYQTNTRTNLALDNYTVNLPAGTNHTRFAISLQPDKTITGLEDEHLSTDGSQVKKFLIDGVLYMQKDGALYDAQGRCVQ